MSDFSPLPKRHRLRILLLLLVAAAVMALPALRGELLEYDDTSLLLGKDGALERSPGSFFTSTYYYAYLPFYGLSYWVDGALGGAEPLVFHLGNVLWHAAATYLVYLLLSKLI
ncbi:MAG: hypothetical protein ACYSUN_16430, partial [Planctomycetota bacterium]